MRLPDAFEPLRGERVWVAWDYEDGAKVPRSKDGGRASTTNPSTWGTYDEVAAAAEHYGWAGVGIVLTDGYAGIDLDGAIGPDGSLLPWAEEIVDSMDSYTEVSPSGTGVHIIVWTDRGKTGPIGRNDRAQGIEVYNHGRYFTVTGDSIGADSIADRTSEVEELVGRLNGPNPEQTLSRAVGAMVYDQVKRLSNRTVSQNCVRDGVRYARVPVGRETCGFCLMLASRGFVYESERSAGELNHYHAHCVLPETNLGSVGARACLRRKYEGVVCHITTRGGRHLSVTPNHPVLTVRGWVDAGHLKDGDALLCRIGGNREEVGVPDVDQTPARADEVFEALRLLLAAVGHRVPSTAVDFDGEPVADGDVEVVDLNGLLECDVVPAGHERLCDKTLALAGLLDCCGALDGSGSPDPLRDGSMPAAHGVMGCCCLLGPLFGSHFGRSDDSSIGASAKLAASLFEPPCDCGPADGIDARKLEHARSVLVSLYKAGRCGEALASRLDAAALQDVKNGVAGYPELFGDFGCLHPGGVEIDYVSVVRHSSFAGHVYNLSTDGGWYFANDIVVHNCDCKVIPGFDGMEVEGYDPDALLDVYESVYYDELGGRKELRRMWSGLSDRDKDERIARHAGSEADAFDAFCDERISDGIALAVYGTTRPHAD